MVKLVRNVILATVVLLLTFLAALVVVDTIPSFVVNARLSNTVATLKKEGLYPSVGLSWRKIVLDNFTDSVMLNIAYSVDSTDPVRSAIRTVMFDGDDHSADQILNLEKLSQRKEVHETVYERYWHGYVIFLRPLLAVTSYAGVRMVLTVALFTIFAAFMVNAWKRLGVRMTFGLLVGFVAVDFFWLGKSLQLSNVFLTGMLGALYFLRKKQLSLSTIGTVFFVVGAVTSYVDVLSAPLVSLGLLLVVTMGLVKSVNFKTLVIVCALWSVGYLSLWALKWVIAEYTYVPGAISVGYKKLQDRTMGQADAQFSRKNTLLRNFYQLRGYDKRNKIVLLVLGIGCTTFMVKFFSLNRVNRKHVALWLAISTIPYLWYGIAAEHSYIHVVFTYRNQFMSVVGVFFVSTEFIDWKRVRKDIASIISKIVPSPMP